MCAWANSKRNGEMNSWNDLRQYDDEHDDEYFMDENKRLEQEYGPYVTMKYTNQSKYGFYCELCDKEMYGEQSLLSHCRGMKHLKKKTSWMDEQNGGESSFSQEYFGTNNAPQIALKPSNLQPVQPVQPVQVDPTANMSNVEKLIYKLGPHCIQDCMDANLALDNLCNLSKSLKEYNRRIDQDQISDMLMEIELKFNTIKALSTTKVNSAFRRPDDDFHRDEPRRPESLRMHHNIHNRESQREYY